jgi:hypothetical protein
MARTTGLGDRFYIAGVDISGNINSLSKIGGGPAAGDMTDITQSAMARQGLLRDGGMDFAVYMDSALAHPVLSALPTTDEIGTYFNGQAIGNIAASCNSKQLNYDWNHGQDGSLLGAVSLVANNFGLEWGVQLTPGHRIDTSATAASGANSLDTGAPLAFGAQMYAHLFAFTGTSVKVVVQDSADNISFFNIAGASLETTALTTAGQAVRVIIPNTTTVRRYIAVGTVGTFSNADFAVMVNKNQAAGVAF